MIFYAEQRVLEEYKTIWDSLSRNDFANISLTTDLLMIYVFADSCKNHLYYIPIPHKSMVRTMFPIYPDMKLSFQVLLKAIFLTSPFTISWWSEQWCLSSLKHVSDCVKDSNWTAELPHKMDYLKEFESIIKSWDLRVLKTLLQNTWQR